MSIQRVLSLNGIFVVRKPSGESSAKTVERVKNGLLGTITDGKQRNTIRRKIKVGHGGTLDPLASGVLVIGVGNGCKQMGTYLHDVKKGYRAVGRFGEEFDTYDRTGVCVEKDLPYQHVNRESIERVLRESFTGPIMQVPPIFSAIHVNGQRAYEMARSAQQSALADKSVREELPSLPPRPVTIHEIKLSDLCLPEFTLEVECSSGTYVRSIVHDLGRALGTAATMYELERFKQGPFDLAACISVESVSDLDLLEKIMIHK